VKNKQENCIDETGNSSDIESRGQWKQSEFKKVLNVYVNHFHIFCYRKYTSM